MNTTRNSLTALALATALMASALTSANTPANAFEIRLNFGGGSAGAYEETEGGSNKEKFLNFGISMMKKALEKEKGGDSEAEFSEEGSESDFEDSEEVYE